MTIAIWPALHDERSSRPTVLEVAPQSHLRVSLEGAEFRDVRKQRSRRRSEHGEALRESAGGGRVPRLHARRERERWKDGLRLRSGLARRKGQPRRFERL